jgi:YesN/AraC family two-component response regulator
MGCAPADHVTRQRVAHARQLPRQTNRSITDIAFELGCNTSAYFASVFKRLTGQSPRTFRENIGARTRLPAEL